MKQILDVCCGSRMSWFNKHHPNAIYMDNRTLDTELCDGRRITVAPDVVADFRDIPFPDNTFRLVVFDPPHLVRAGENSWMAKKYGVLSETWPQDIHKGFTECMRVLKPGGTLNFKWNEEQIKLRAVLDAIGEQPLFGDRRSKTHWLVFMKPAPEEGEQMYEKLIERLREYPDREETAGGYVEVDWQDLLDAADALESLTAQLATLQSENAEKGMEIERLKSELLEAREDYMASEMQREQGEDALARVEAERDEAMERQKELDDALRDMVCQYCSHDGRLDHEFMSAGEHAFDVLDLDYGAPVDMLWRGAQGEG